MQIGKKTLELLRLRSRKNSTPGTREDRHHLALVLEGGGMRAVTTGGFVCCLEKLGLLSVFDSVHGSSAGAAAGAYFIAGQACQGTRIYYEDLIDSRFINFGRLLVRQPIMNLDFLISDVMQGTKLLDVDRILRSQIPINIVCTDVERGTRHCKSTFETKEVFWSYLKASMTMPFLAGPPLNVDSFKLYDGGLTQQLAVESAIEFGATHIVTFMSRNRIGVKRKSGAFWRELEAMFLGLKYGQSFGDIYRRRSIATRKSVEICASWDRQQELGVDVLPISIPPHLNYVSRLTKSAKLLRRAQDEVELHVRNVLQL